MTALNIFSRIFLGSVAAVALVVSCKESKDSEVRSLIGMEAGRDAVLRNTPSPIFVALSMWFETYKLQTDPPAGNRVASTASLNSKLPPSYTNSLKRYLDVQERRADVMLAALDNRQTKKLAELLDLETKEMADIALVIIYPREIPYIPATDDILANLMAGARGQSDFVDRFAAQGFLEPLLRLSLVNEPGDSGKQHSLGSAAKLAGDIDRQRLIYLEALKKRYLTDDRARTDFRAQLARSRQSIAALKQALGAGGQATGLALSDAPSASMSGSPAVFANFLTEAEKKASAKTQATPLSSDVFVTPNSAASGSGTGSDPSTTADDGINVNAQSAWMKAVEIPPVASASKSSPTPTPPTSPSAPAKPARKPSPAPSPKPPTGKRGPSDRADSDVSIAEGDLNGFNEFNDSMASIIPLGEGFDESSGGFALDSGRARGLRPPLPEPFVDCLKLGLRGPALIECNRRSGFSNLKLPKTKRAVKSTAGLALSTSMPKELADILYNKVIPGPAEEDGKGHIFNQGPVGSCSLQAALGGLYILLQELGIEPRKLLPSDGPKINEVFANEQRGEATLEAALDTAQGLVADEVSVDATAVDWEGALACIASGHPVLLGMPIDMTTWGQGLEFGGDGNYPENSGLLTCNPAGGSGHAIVAVGYDKDHNLLIKNSWGLWNGSGKGTGFVSQASCSADTTAYCMTATKKL